MDVCHCGDYRHQHDAKGCAICRWDGPTRCEQFRLHERAQAPEDSAARRGTPQFSRRPQ